MSTQKPIADNLFTWPSDSPKLIGSKDSETGRYFFPAKNSNQHERVELSSKGKLWTWTVPVSYTHLTLPTKDSG